MTFGGFQVIPTVRPARYRTLSLIVIGMHGRSGRHGCSREVWPNGWRATFVASSSAIKQPNGTAVYCRAQEVDMSYESSSEKRMLTGL